MLSRDFVGYILAFLKFQISRIPVYAYYTSDLLCETARPYQKRMYQILTLSNELLMR